ncbi:MAG: Fic family protein [Candidatus Aenigmarchaeota archaeon]|nr:Fic family protein [Candidatus Aenigmarchaeota archaeon]MDI6722078.1 Fic family protein [Candidatus Aenigmarchaeota archaeon]
MALRTKIIKGKKYYYLDLSYSVSNKSKTFSKYVGVKKPLRNDIAKIEHSFKSEIISKLSGKHYDNKLISKDDLIKALLFRGAFNNIFSSLSGAQKRKYEADSTILFTLTTLTTEDVNVSMSDVQNAFEKNKQLSTREQISKNMLKAVKSIKENHILDKKYLLGLHKTIMASFEGKTPGRIRKQQVYLHMQDIKNPLGKEIAYRPPHYNRLNKLIDEFVEWYKSTKLNPIEKAALAHYNLYRIHPFLDGNKRICRLILNKTLLDEGFPLLNISAKKEPYFQSLISSVEKDTPKKLAEFTLKEFFRQTKEFLTLHRT